MSIEPLQVMPGPVWGLINEYCKSLPLMQWIYPHIYQTGSLFREGHVSSQLVRECEKRHLAAF